MRIPTGGVGLHKTHAALKQAPRQQQTLAEILGAVIIQSVRGAGGFLFLTEIKNAGHLHLHAVSQLIAIHACGQIGMAGALGGVLLIEPG